MMTFVRARYYLLLSDTNCVGYGSKSGSESGSEKLKWREEELCIRCLPIHLPMGKTVGLYRE